MYYLFVSKRSNCHLFSISLVNSYFYIWYSLFFCSASATQGWWPQCQRRQQSARHEARHGNRRRGRRAPPGTAEVPQACSRRNAAEEANSSQKASISAVVVVKARLARAEPPM